MPRTIGNGLIGGFLESDRNSVITISLEFVDEVVLVESVPVSWNVGDVDFLKNLFFLDGFVIVRVIDIDMNLNPEVLDVVPIPLFSGSDVTGIEVNTVETSKRSGSFITTISTSQNFSFSGSRLYILPGDEIFATYDDHTLSKPFSKSDHFKIDSFAKVDSYIPYVKRLEISAPVFSDGVGSILESFSSNTQIQIVGL